MLSQLDRIIEEVHCIMFFCAIQLALYIMLKNFHCDAIIPVVKLFWCVALDVDHRRKSETFLF